MPRLDKIQRAAKAQLVAQSLRMLPDLSSCEIQIMRGVSVKS
jgi:hypothetical protein